MRINLMLSIMMVMTFLFVSCSDDKKVQEERNTETILWYEVMKIHDEVMPKLSEINRLTRGLNRRKEALPEIMESQYAVTLKNLAAAEDGMMDWMTELKQLEQMRETESHETIMSYLNEEKTKIRKVSKDIKESLRAAEMLKTQIDQYK